MHEIPLIKDAAETLGSRYMEKLVLEFTRLHNVDIHRVNKNWHAVVDGFKRR
jgi:dTDP-4-amino-4,6-dideoxygalactose transaminase